MVCGTKISTASQGAPGTAVGPLTSKFWWHYAVNPPDGVCKAETQLKSFTTNKFYLAPKKVESACIDCLKLVIHLAWGKAYLLTLV